jgi:hypothetical protein
VKFKIDENPLELAVHLGESSYDAETVTSENLSGAEDATLFYSS